MWRPLALVLVLAAFGCQSCQNDDEDCPSGQTLCNGVCRDAAYFQTSPLDCGACGVACGAGTCVAGACQCDPGATRCPTNPQCADLQNDPNNCGACGVPCADKPGETCAGGTCGCHAPASADCGSYCADTLNDPSNCGLDAASGCGHACPLANDVCDAGVCACPASLQTQCGNACVNTLADPSHCGPADQPASCDRACATNEVCSVGACACEAPFTTCGTACVDPRTDEQNCGGCGNVCPPGTACTGPGFTCACPAGESLCGSACVDTTTDAQNCGGCAGAGGVACATNHFCCTAQCCPGTGACCANGACETEHANGLTNGANANYYDCGQRDQWTAAQARLAAESWSPTGAPVEPVPQCGTPFCVCRPNASGSAVWCYTGSPPPMPGHVLFTPSATCLTAACPFGAAPAWH